MIDFLGDPVDVLPLHPRKPGVEWLKFFLFFLPFLGLFPFLDNNNCFVFSYRNPRAEPVTVTLCHLRKAVGEVGPEHTKSGAYSSHYQPVTLVKLHYYRRLRPQCLKDLFVIPSVIEGGWGCIPSGRASRGLI